MNLRSANRGLMRDLNRSLVLTAVKNRGPISRTGVAAQCGLGPSTVTHIVGDLLEAGLVREVASGPSTGGRRPILLEIDPAGGYALGLKLTEQAITLALTDLDGTVTQTAVAPSADPHDLDAYLARLEAVIHGFLDRAAIPGEKLIGIGIGLSGFIDHDAGRCRHSALLGWHDVPLRDLLEKRLDAPVVLDNDVNTLTLYEALFGSGRGLSDFLVVTLGRGVGMGAYVNGRMLRGAHGGAGEFGHMPVLPEGPLCNCGNRGCLEALVSEPALVGQAQTQGLPVTTPEDLLALAAAGNPQATAIYAGAAAWLGLGLATLVNLFNPAQVIVSGEGARATRFLLPGLQETLSAHVFNGLGSTITLVVEPLEDYAWARGAASLALNELFNPPIYDVRVPIQILEDI